jgi:hypothetical protein
VDDEFEDDDDLSAHEIAAAIAAAILADDDDDSTEIPPSPWAHLDTSAVAFVFAAQLASASADLFRNLATLALGQSAHDWAEQDRKDFADSMLRSLGGLPETAPEAKGGAE